jgi:hypothetical protein
MPPTMRSVTAANDVTESGWAALPRQGVVEPRGFDVQPMPRYRSAKRSPIHELIASAKVARRKDRPPDSNGVQNCPPARRVEEMDGDAQRFAQSHVDGAVRAVAGPEWNPVRNARLKAMPEAVFTVEDEGAREWHRRRQARPTSGPALGLTSTHLSVCQTPACAKSGLR